MHSVRIGEEAELEAIARNVLDTLGGDPARHVIALRGDLGAGKTTFTKALSRVLGVTEQVTSPTFVVMRSYPLSRNETFTRLVHIDAYRIEDERELEVLGFNEIAKDTKQLIVIEWPERVSDLIGEDALFVDISITEGTDRLITYGD